MQFTSYTGIAALNSYVLGIGVMAFAAIALARSRMWEEQVNLILDLWLVIAPFALDFRVETAAMINRVVLGMLIVGDAIWAVKPYYTRKAT